MKSLIEVFRMDEIPAKKRANVIIKLGKAINDEYQMNITEGLVYELITILDPQNEILKDEAFVKRANAL